jgi:uncharacterized lipoprotein NlpE involved in copper resistance
MKKYTLFALIALLAVSAATIGCDNRSQLEKDADAAAKKLEQKLGN